MSEGSRQEQETRESEQQPFKGHAVNCSPYSSNCARPNSKGPRQEHVKRDTDYQPSWGPAVNSRLETLGSSYEQERRENCYQNSECSAVNRSHCSNYNSPKHEQERRENDYQTSEGYVENSSPHSNAYIRPNSTGLRHEQDRRGTDYQPDRGQAVYTSPPSRNHYDRPETIGYVIEQASNTWMSYYNPWTKDTKSSKEEREKRNKLEKVKREQEEAEEKKKEEQHPKERSREGIKSC
ncbi:uncharacterized protein LOC111699577 isoform X2 [Eurytemora carolleeae]|uniref:uncharacterized protein LOC111699577 isoform X2 n=1 Tax=Eurytemora carolleeae TaxID=1294199 RepID=UPI000C77B7A0|nr:uncharacterized protein LOC111699577 isoform X2 [Eurytemora carolleeae]|eukprot:XP_023326050.1 uncharacterized protein LOC111699577 isoform X2 [Eurytemora affinis]